MPLKRAPINLSVYASQLSPKYYQRGSMGVVRIMNWGGSSFGELSWKRGAQCTVNYCGFFPLEYNIQ